MSLGMEGSDGDRPAAVGAWAGGRGDIPLVRLGR